MILNLDTESNKKLAIWGIIIVCAISIGLRFWGLGRFNAFVFDEVYYAKFANNYLTNTPFYNSHPPLSQYLIAIGIWIGDRLPIGQDTTNTLTGSLHSTFSYRWMNALFGSLIPPVVAALAYQLNPRLSFALLAALFISLDGLFLIDSRYALNNIFLIFFGLLGQLLVLVASRDSHSRHPVLMVGAGISFGAAVACKWNGLWFLLGIYIAIFVAKAWKLVRSDLQSPFIANSILDRLANIRLIEVAVSLTIVPMIIYSLLWIPHLSQNPYPNFIDVQKSILNYHEQVGTGDKIHPYCASWFTWPLMMRPLAYYFTEYQPNYYYDVHAMGNPLLWWLALGAIFALMWSIVKNFSRTPATATNIDFIGVPLFIVINYTANLFPWLKVSRCLFIYHYMGAVLFAIIGLAWLVDLCLRSSSKLWQSAGLTAIFGIAAAFIFWLPVYLGLPIEKTDLYYRLWDFWIFNWI